MKPTDTWVRKPPSFMRIGSSSGCKSQGSKKRGLDYHRRVYGLLRYHVRNHLPGWELLVEPWYRNLNTRRFRQPDAVLIYPETQTGIVVEVKLNWKDGRDLKLINEYLHIVRAAEGLECVWPLLITRCLRGYGEPPLLGLAALAECQSWFPGDPTPVMLLP